MQSVKLGSRTMWYPQTVTYAKTYHPSLFILVVYIFFLPNQTRHTVIVKIVDRKNVPVCQKTPKSSRIFTVQHFLGGFFCVSSFWFFGFFFPLFHPPIAGGKGESGWIFFSPDETSVFSRIWSFWLTGVHRAKKCVYFFPRG